LWDLALADGPFVLAARQEWILNSTGRSYPCHEIALAASLAPKAANATLPNCPKAFVDKWMRGPPDVVVIPAKKCVIYGATGAHVCIRDKGCLNLGAYDEMETRDSSARLCQNR
jgi:hypothetical protein